MRAVRPFTMGTGRRTGGRLRRSPQEGNVRTDERHDDWVRKHLGQRGSRAGAAAGPGWNLKRERWDERSGRGDGGSSARRRDNRAYLWDLRRIGRYTLAGGELGREFGEHSN